MPEKIAFRGMYPADAEKLEMKQYTTLVKARERRTIKRNGLDYRRLLAKVEEYKKSGKAKAVRTHIREAVIIPSWIGVKFEVHNGKEFQPVQVMANMLGHRLGEFAFSTKRVLHSAPGIRATRGSKFLAVK
ncbi:MAG TPA: ribosomal protein S19 family protein [Candidatus Baltobacteraceae bacterium]|nr:ribosomal protein S19 family protein [Candidatus Baltobacteraceae bacterium]